MELKQWIFIGIVTISAYLLSLITRRIIHFYIRKNSRILLVDPTNFNFIKNSVTFVIFILAAVIIFLNIPRLSDLGKALFAGAGVLAAIIGFASQKAFANIISGIFILIFKPFRITDVIEVEGQYRGTVEEITLRHTVIRNYENRRIIIPNSAISEATLINSSITDQRIRKHIVFQISYESDIDIARRIIIDEIEKHPLLIDTRSEEEKKVDQLVPVRVVGLGDSGVSLKAWAWAATSEDAFLMECDILESIKKRFSVSRIEIPYPQTTIHLKKGDH
jgi:small conductance mechanosensitive channel